MADAPLVPEQRAAVEDRGRDLFLSAAAGSGKTRVLVERFCEAVCADSGADADVGVQNVLAFTFTEKAAAELAARIRTELRARGADTLAREAESAWISTIHAFCRRLLAAHPLAAGLDPRFTVLDELGARLLASEAFAAAFDAFAAGPGEERWEMAAAFGVRSLEEIVVSAHDELRSRGQDPPRLPEAREPDVPGALAELQEAAREALTESEGACGPGAGEHRERMARALELSLAEVDEQRVGECAFKSSAAAFQGPAVERYRAACEALRSRLVERDHRGHYDCLRELLDLFAQEYARRKAARSALDFEDLQLAACRLLESRPELRRRYQRQFAHLMVDELQDTNELQLRLIRLLHTEGGVPQNRLFTVGDQFQSIYAFRHADVEVFRREERRIAAMPEEAAAVRRLSGNFRSRPEVVAPVNRLGGALFGAAFEPLVVGLAPERAEPRAGGPAVELLVTESEGWDAEGVQLDVSEDERAPLWRVAEARFLARRLRELADAGYPRADMAVLLRSFTHVETYEQALEAEGLAPYVVGGRGYWSSQQVTDVRRLLTVVANPLDELALFGALASPFCGASADALWLLRQAAGARRVWSALRRLYGPEPQEPEDDEMAGWAAHVPAEDAAALRDFTARLLELRAEAPRLGLDALIERALAVFGYDLALLMRPGGARRMANVRKLERLARAYEDSDGRDLRGFLAFLDAQGEIRAREGEAALDTAEHDGVRLMTVHAAKGLEFPLVAVADLGRRIQSGAPALRLGKESGDGADPALRVGLRLARLGRERAWIFDYGELHREAAELESEEERRIFHVAITRAQERLVLSGACRRAGLGGEPRPSTPLMERVLAALGSDGSAGSVLLEPPPLRQGLSLDLAAVEVAVRLEEPTPETEAEVERTAARIALDPDVDGVRPGRPLPDPELRPLAPPPASAVDRVSYSALSLYGRCGYRFYAERVLRMAPRRPHAPPPDDADEPRLAGERDEWAEAEELDSLSLRYARGNVVHRLLERSARSAWAPVDLDAAATLLRAEGIEPAPAEVERVVGLAGAFLESPLRGQLALARAIHPETPFVFRLGDLVVRGEIDLLADLGEEMLVLDYKSDRLDGASPAERMDRYEVQRQIYALAALRRYGRPVRVAYVFLEAPDDPVEARFEPEDVGGLAAELARLSEGLRGGEFPVTDRPGKELCHDCPARERLCVHGPERTLA